MPALPAVNNVIQVTYDFTIGEDTVARCREFFGFNPSGGPGLSNAQAQDIANAIQSSWSTNLKSMHPAEVILTAVKVQGLTSATDGFGENATPITGTRSGTALTASVCLLQSLHVARRYRGGHPRTYWPFGVHEDLFSAQRWDSTFVTAVGTALAAHFTDWSTDLPSGITGVFPVNVSYYEGFVPIEGSTGRTRDVNKPRTNPLVDVIVNFAIQAGIATLRRRMLRLA